jgi:uncharacterized protein YjbI with pentapeptide repeats
MSSKSNDKQSLITLGQNRKRQISKLAGGLKSVGDFLSEAIDKTKEMDFPEAIKRAAPWAERILGAAAGAASEVLLPIKFVVKLAEKLTEINDPELLGHLACTIAFERATEHAVEEIGGPAEKRTVMEEAKAQLATLEPCEDVDLGTFSYDNAINHPFFQKADLNLQTALIMVGYTQDQINRITDKVKDNFVLVLRTLLTSRETSEKFAPFKEFIELGGAQEREGYKALAEHGEYQRWLYEEAPVLGKSPFALKHIYVDTECGRLTWGEINPPETQVVGRRAPVEKHSLEKPDPFSEQHGGRHPLLDTVLNMIAQSELREPIVIQAIAGAGKSSFTVRLCAELLKRRLRPIRIRLKNLRFDKHVSEALPQAVELSDEVRSPDGIPPTPKNLFRQGKIFDENGFGAYDKVSRYVLILDGWDEISLSNESFKRRIERMLEQLRAEYIDNPSRPYPVRVIITGRPSEDVNESGFLRDKTPFLTIRPFSPNQLKQFVFALSEAVKNHPLNTPGMDEWPPFDSSRFEPILRRYDEEFSPAKSTRPSVNRSVGALSLPLLAHLAARLISVWKGNPETLVEDSTTLYRNLVNLTCAKSGKYESDEEVVDEIREQSRIVGADLRRLLWQTATAMTIYGKDLVPYEELAKRLELEDEQLDEHVTEATGSNMLSSLLISFYFKGGIKHLGCEFAHKSFREYLFAEAIVEALKEYGDQANSFVVDRGSFWRDFSQDDPRFGFSRELAQLLAPQWLSAEVIAHIDSLIKWEIGRSTDPGKTVDSGVVTQPRTLEKWRLIRDGLADLWDWWGEGVHLRCQPQLGNRRELKYEPPYVTNLIEYSLPFVSSAPPGTTRTTTMDAHLGYGLFNLCVLTHFYLLDLESEESARRAVNNERRYQSVIRNPHTGRQGVRFAPSGHSREYFYNYIHRIAAAGLRPQGIFPVGADLRGVDLSGAYLLGVDFYAANLDSTILRSALLSGATFTSATIRECVLDDSHLRGASMLMAVLTSTTLINADVGRVDFTSTTLDHVNFARAYLESSRFDGAQINNTVFDNALLKCALFIHSRFQHVSFRKADLSQAVFDRTELDEVSFAEAQLTQTIFKRVRLKDTELNVPQNQLFLDLRSEQSDE